MCDDNLENAEEPGFVVDTRGSPEYFKRCRQEDRRRILKGATIIGGLLAGIATPHFVERYFYLETRAEAETLAAGDRRFNVDGGEFSIDQYDFWMDSLKPWDEGRTFYDGSRKDEPSKACLRRYIEERKAAAEKESPINHKSMRA